MSQRSDSTYNGIAHEMYRVYDAEDRLLYVGMGRDASTRMHQHVDVYNSQVQASHLMAGLMASYYVETHGSRSDARDAERDAIRAEHPMFNKQGNKGWQIMRDEYFVLYGGSDDIGRLNHEAIMRRYQGSYMRTPPERFTMPEPFVRDREWERRRSLEFIVEHNLHKDGLHPFETYVPPGAAELREVLNSMFKNRTNA
jgi:predicted GIY-YIG superfamily endonuclease